MTIDTFFEKFEQFADAPGAVGKMRELVLELAVRGRLVPSREPESSVVSGLFPIPADWQWSILDDVAEACGQTKPDSRFTYVDVGAIDNVQGRITDSVQQIEAADAPSRARKLVRPGCVLYATVRPYLRNVAIFERQFSPPAIVSTAFAVLCPRPSLDVRYLFYWLRSQSFQDEVTERMKGVAYPAICDSDFWKCQIPLPPLAEQKRTVAKVDELMALCDQLQAQLQARKSRHAVLAHAALARVADAPTPANLQLLFHPSYAISAADLRKSILTLAFQGDLTKCEEGNLAKVDAERVMTDAASARRSYWSNRHGPKRKYPEPESVEAEDLPRIGRHWIWASIDSVCAQVTDGEHIQPPYQAVGVPMLSAKHVRDGYVTLDGAGLISEGAFQKSIERCQPENGDILIVSVGATTGRSAIVADCPRFAIVRSVLLLKPVIMNEYLLWWLKNPWAFTWMTQASGASAQPHLYIRDLKHMPVPIPPLAEQRRLVARVNELMVLVDELETHLAASLATAANLLSAVVAELTGSERPASVGRRV